MTKSFLVGIAMLSAAAAWGQEQVTLLCRGKIQNEAHRFLNGNTNNGAVDLAVEADQAHHSGAIWEVVHLKEGEVAFRCMGNVHNPKFVFLNGMTGDGKVNLAPDTNPPYTGTHWKEMRLPDGTMTYLCMGTDKNTQHRYLNGLTQTGGVDLAADNDEANASGTHWEVHPVVEEVTLWCKGKDVNPEHRFLNGNTNNGVVDLSPDADPKRFSGAVWQVEHLQGREVLLKCMGNVHNPKYVYLNGLTADGKVELAPDTKGAFSGTHWEEVVQQDGTIAFRCLGTNKNPKYEFLNGLTRSGGVNLTGDTREGDASGTHWEAHEVR